MNIPYFIAISTLSLFLSFRERWWCAFNLCRWLYPWRRLGEKCSLAFIQTYIIISAGLCDSLLRNSVNVFSL